MIRDAAVYLLNQLVLQPAGWKPFTTGYDIDDGQWIASVPTSAGVYLLYTPGHHYAHPGGSSSVLYIGKATGSEGLRTRLRNHRKYAREVRDGIYDRGYARYEWMITHPARAAYIAAPTSDANPKTMEHRLLLVFADAFRVAPLGNAQSAWAEEFDEQD